jgi:hypothetical protein
MSELVILLDVLITVAAGGSAWLWWAASRHQVRRVRGDADLVGTHHAAISDDVGIEDGSELAL